MIQVGVVGRSKAIPTRASAPPTMLPISTVRKPNRRMQRAGGGLDRTLPANSSST